MAPTKAVPINAADLSNAVEFVSFGEPFENSAYICLDDGKIYWRSASAGLEDEDLPEDLGSSDRYLEVPHKNDLDLGRRLALAFVNKELPGDADTVAAFFRRRGAYRRFKELLNARGMLQQWFDFESRATEKALRAWCEENGIQLVDG